MTPRSPKRGSGWSAFAPRQQRRIKNWAAFHRNQQQQAQQRQAEGEHRPDFADRTPTTPDVDDQTPAEDKDDRD